MEQTNRTPPIDIPRHDTAEAIARFNQTETATVALARLNTMTMSTSGPSRRSPSRIERVATSDGLSAPVNQSTLPASLTFQALAQLNGAPSPATLRRAATELYTGDEGAVNSFSFTEYRDRDEDSDSSVSYEYVYESEYESEYEDSSSESSEALAEVMECCICFEEPSASDVATIDGCAHKFCINCVTQWGESSNQCPLCRTRFTSIQSEGGVLHQVPDRRLTVAIRLADIVPLLNPARDLADSFDREEGSTGEGEDGDNYDPFTAMLRRMVEVQTITRRHDEVVERLERPLQLRELGARQRLEETPRVDREAIRLETHRVEERFRHLDAILAEMNSRLERVSHSVSAVEAILEQTNSNL